MARNALEARIASLRGRVRRMLALHGLSWVTFGLILAVIAAGLADWLIHLAPEVRLVTLLGVIALGGWLTLRYVLAPLVVRFDDLDLGLKIERRWPGLNDRLSSTLEFLESRKAGDDDEDRHGSRQLREATVEQTLKETESIDFREVVDPQPARKALALAVVALTLGGALTLTAPETCRLAVDRLFRPFGGTQWPKRTHLELVSAPEKVARGEPFSFEVAVRKGDVIPPTARVTYRFPDAESTEESLRTDGEGRFMGRIETVNRPFQFSVQAGDDQTTWRNVAVVPPPAIQEALLTTTPPAYTRLSAQTLAPGRTQVRAVIGSRVAIAAIANKPLASARLRRGDIPDPQPVALDASRRRLSVGFDVEESGPFWFELVDTDGFRSRESIRYELSALADEPPRVVLDDPVNDQYVTPIATVPIRATIDDDFGIQRIRIVYSVAAGNSEPTRQEVIPLYPTETVTSPSKHLEVRYRWDLSGLQLTPGAIVAFHVEAIDFDDLRGPNLGKSRELRLRVISAEEFQPILADRQRELREEVQRILEMQQQALTGVQDAARILDQAERLDPANREQLKSAGTVQRQVGNRISDPADGLEEKAQRFLDDLENNKIEDADAREQMEQIRQGAQKLREQNVGPAEQNITRANKTLENLEEPQPGQPAADSERPTEGPPQSDRERGASPGEKAQATRQPPNQGKSVEPEGRAERSKGEAPTQPGELDKPAPQPPADRPDEPLTPIRSARASLAQAETNQNTIADELQRMLDGLREFETKSALTRDAEKLLKNLEEVMKQSANQAQDPKVTGRTPEQLEGAKRAELENLAARQSELADQLRNLENNLEEMSQRIDQADPITAGGLKDAAQQSRQRGTSGKMSQAADQIQRNQMGNALSRQDQARQDLQQLVDSLKNHRENELSRLVKELKQAGQDMEKLRERQARNLIKTQDAKANPDEQQRAQDLQKLAKEQAAIQKELERQLQRLRKLRADAAAQAGSRASGKMSKAQQDLDDNDAEDAEQAMRDALQDLQDAQEEIEQQQQEAEDLLAMEQLAKMTDDLKQISERQDRIVQDTEEYEKLRVASNGKFTSAQRADVRTLGQVESRLKDETSDLIERLEGAPVFALTLKKAAEHMELAARRLQRFQTDEDTQGAEKAAARRLKQLLESLKPDLPGNGGQQDGGGGGGGGGGAGGAGDGIPTAAQVKMLKALQKELNERTEQLDELVRRDKELTPEQRTELDQLHEDQRTLADLARDMTKPARDDGEE